MKAQARERRPGNVCLRRHRRAPQALPGGGSRRGREGAAEQEHGQRDRAAAAADRRSARRDAGGVRGRVRLGLAAPAARGLRVRPAPGAPAAVQGHRLGAAEERQGPARRSWRSCCGRTCCPRRGSPRRRCGSSARCCGTGPAWSGSAPSSGTGSTRWWPTSATTGPAATCPGRAGASWPGWTCPRCRGRSSPTAWR